MSIVLDLIGSSILLGLLIMAIMGVNINMSTETQKSASEFHTQTELIQLGRIFESDFYKIGYDFISTPGHHKIEVADSNRIKFHANLYNVVGGSDSVEYQLGNYVTWSTNPRDKILARFENTTKVFINYSITRFKIEYYDSKDSLLASPVTGNWLDSINSVRVYLSIESPEPIGQDTVTAYASGYYEKMIYPRNL